jgi:hypothetical protein
MTDKGWADFQSLVLLDGLVEHDGANISSSVACARDGLLLAFSRRLTCTERVSKPLRIDAPCLLAFACITVLK